MFYYEFVVWVVVNLVLERGGYLIIVVKIVLFIVMMNVGLVVL